MTQADTRVTDEFKIEDAGNVNTRLSTRRAALRKLGITTGAALFGMLAGDQLIRLVGAGIARSEGRSFLAKSIADELRSSGVALAQDVCGVYVDGCPECVQILGGPPCPCGSGFAGPCCNCSPPDDCTDCTAVALYAKCQCLQDLANRYGSPCCDCSGIPLGNPLCPAYNVAVQLCDDQYDYAIINCG